MPLPSGTRLGPYEILAPLGAGGMGEVYRARDPRLNRDVAVKVLPQQAAATPEMRARFEREARTVSAFSHPHICTLHDVGREGDTDYLVMELVEGVTLQERIARGRVPVEEALPIARQIAEGLEYAHERGIVHRDLKPANVKLRPDGALKILDFGLARPSSDESAGADATRTPTITAAATRAGAILGTAAYMSPEQARGKPVDRRTDIWAFGCLLYEMLTGRVAFRGETITDTLAAVVREEPDMAGLPAETPARVRDLIRRCLAKDPKRRIHDVADARLEIEEAIASPSPFPAGADAGPRRRPRALPLVLGGSLVVGAVLGAFVIGRSLPGAGRAAAVTYQQITFRLGSIGNARFAPDGKSILYSASRDGRNRLFAAVPGNAETRSLLDRDAGLYAVSPRGELALSILSASGTRQLARAELAGGAPRAIADDVLEAEWSPDGNELLIIRGVGGRRRLEYPVGNIRLETDAAGLMAKPAPHGAMIAFVEYRVPSYTTGQLELLDGAGHRRALTRTYAGLNSFAWRPDGKEIWYTCGESLTPRTLCAVGLDGKSRVLLESPVELRIHDIAPDGRVLVTTESFHHRIAGRLAGSPLNHEVDLSWFEGSDQPVLSADGRRLLSTVLGNTADVMNTVFLRDAGAEAAVRLGVGNVLALSPDGEQALVGRGPRQSDLSMLPTGSGSERRLDSGGLELVTWAHFFPDGKRIALVGREPGHRLRVWLLDSSGGAPRPISEEGVITSCPPSPDGAWIAAFTPERGAALLPIDGGAARPIDGIAPARLPIARSADGRTLFVRVLDEVERLDGHVTTAAPVHVERFDPSRDATTPWRDFVPGEHAGRTHLDNLCITADGAL